MPTMIDKVADAIAEAYSRSNIKSRELIEEMARAAIRAMREPTKEMITENYDATPYFDFHRADDAAGIWRKMIDIAFQPST